MTDKFKLLGRMLSQHVSVPGERRLSEARARLRAICPDSPSFETFEAYACELVRRSDAVSVAGALEGIHNAILVGLSVDVILRTTPLAWWAYDKIGGASAIERLYPSAPIGEGLVDISDVVEARQRQLPPSKDAV